MKLLFLPLIYGMNGSARLKRRRHSKYRDSEPEIERGLLGLKDVDDVGGIAGKLVQRHPHFLLRVMHWNVHVSHKTEAEQCSILTIRSPAPISAPI